VVQAAAQSKASAAHAMQRFARREFQASPDVSLATSLHPPLTLPRQPPHYPVVMEEAVQHPHPAQEQRPEQQQQPAKAEQQQQPSHATSAVVKQEPTAVAAPAGSERLPRLPTTQQSMDLYADLDLQGRASSGRQQLHAATSSHAPAKAAPVMKQNQQLQQPPSGIGADAGQKLVASVHGNQAAQPPSEVQEASRAGGVAPQQPSAEIGTTRSLQALLSNPTALQALLKDPAQLQRLLEKHPALISVLKSTLGHKS